MLPQAVGKGRDCPCRVSEQRSLQEVYKETLQYCRCTARVVCCTVIYFSCNPDHCIIVLMSILNLWLKIRGTIRTGLWKYRFINVEHFYLGPSWYCWTSTQPIEVCSGSVVAQSFASRERPLRNFELQPVFSLDHFIFKDCLKQNTVVRWERSIAVRWYRSDPTHHQRC